MSISNIKNVIILTITVFFSLLALPNLVPNGVGPTWFKSLQFRLGLDLKGGSSILFEIDENDIAATVSDSGIRDVREILRQKHMYFSNLKANKENICLVLQNEKEFQTLEKAVESIGMIAKLHGNLVTITVSSKKSNEFRRTALMRSIEVLDRRINEFGTSEPSIQSVGDNRILLQLPGIDNLEEVKTVLGQTARLTFHLVRGDGSEYAEIGANGTLLLNSNNRVPSDSLLVTGDSEILLVSKTPIVSGESLVNANVSFDQFNNPSVGFKFDSLGSSLFGESTLKNIGKRIAIVLDGKLLSAPKISSAILGGSGVIQGKFSMPEANQLALMMRSGALPVKLNVIEEKMIGPSLGQDAINAGALATMISIATIIVFMFLIYKRFGIFANTALLANLLLLTSAISIFGITLTLPGIAGIALTLGMAVDANILINERIREEVLDGQKLTIAVQNGYDRASQTILDANITTLMGGLCLMFFSSGPIRGFAITLIIGVLISMFTAILFSRILITMYLQRNKNAKLLQDLDLA
jgi:preprotein translocase subunit SecD